MFKKRKYKIVDKQDKTTPMSQSVKLYRIQALIDIPLHNVKAGDLGGWMSQKNILSHKGDAWIGGDAIVELGLGYLGGIVRGSALVTDNAYLYHAQVGNFAIIAGNAHLIRSTISGKSWVGDNVEVKWSDFKKNNTNIHLSGNAKISHTIFGGNVNIKGNVIIREPESGHENTEIIASDGNQIDISGDIHLLNTNIYGKALLQGKMALESVTMKFDNEIIGEPQIMPNATFTGTNVLHGECFIPPGSHAHNVTLDGGILTYDYGVQGNIKEILPIPENTKNQKYINLIHDIQEEYESYTTDIVKLIKYPAMVDLSVPEIKDLAVKLRTAQRAIKSGDFSEIEQESKTLEEAFLCAENKAKTLVDSHLDDANRKSLKDAGQMFKLACDDGSTEPEKRMGFKAGMKSLSGVILVSDKALENMKSQVGLLELEA